MTKPPALPKPEPPAVTVTVAAQITGLSREAIIKWYREGKLQGYRMGLAPKSPIMIYVESLEAFMKARKRK